MKIQSLCQYVFFCQRDGMLIAHSLDFVCVFFRISDVWLLFLVIFENYYVQLFVCEQIPGSAY